MTKPRKTERLKERQKKNRLKSQNMKNSKLQRKYSESFIAYKNAEGSVIHFKTRLEFIVYKEKMKKTGVSELNLMKGLILYPKTFSEFEIQAYVYNSLIQIGVDVRAEVRAKNSSGRINILDLVIFKDKAPVMILEIKKNRTQNISEQKIEYGNYGIPMRFIMGMKSAEEYIRNPDS